MGYGDIVRKVYGKVRIIYSDSEISQDIVISSSGDAPISSKQQVVEEYITPTVKACTMDGNANMDGTFQMQTSGMVMGWWSSTSSSSEGNFDMPYPYLEASYISRPIIRWNIIGDNKLMQYPIDFDLILYGENNAEYARVDIRNNTSVSCTVKLEPAIANVVKIRIDIRKWSAPNARIKLLQFFDIVEEIYEGGDIKEFEVLEELSANGEAEYGVKSDTASITLYNKERKFDMGYLKSLVLLDRKVVPFIGIEEGGVINWTKLGTFFSDEWDIPQTDQWAKLKCVDKLMRLQNIIYLGYPLSVNVSLYDLAVDVATKAGFKTEELVLDESLQELIVYNAFMPKRSVWDSLQDIANSGLCNVFIDRNDRLNIKCDNEESIASGIFIRPNRILEYSKKNKLTDFANYIQVNYSDITVGTSLTEVYEGVISVDAGQTLTMVVDYSGNVSGAVMTFTPMTGFELIDFTSGIDAGEFKIKNTTNTIKTITVIIKGYTVTITKSTIAVTDSDSIEMYGIQQYNHTESDLVQSYDRAEEIGRHLLARLRSGNGTIVIKWRGDPNLQLENTFECEGRFGETGNYVNKYNRYVFNGGLKQDTKARKL